MCVYIWDLNPRPLKGIRPCVQLTLRANLVQPLQIHLFLQCSHFISAIGFVCGKICFKRNLAQVFELVAEWIYTYGIHHRRIFRSSYRKATMSGTWTHDHWIPFRGSNPLRYQAMSSTHTQSKPCTATPTSSLFSVFTFHFARYLRKSPHLL